MTENKKKTTKKEVVEKSETPVKGIKKQKLKRNRKTGCFNRSLNKTGCFNRSLNKTGCFNRSLNKTGCFNRSLNFR